MARVDGCRGGGVAASRGSEARRGGTVRVSFAGSSVHRVAEPLLLLPLLLLSCCCCLRSRRAACALLTRRRSVPARRLSAPDALRAPVPLPLPWRAATALDALRAPVPLPLPWRAAAALAFCLPAP